MEELRSSKEKEVAALRMKLENASSKFQATEKELQDVNISLRAQISEIEARWDSPACSVATYLNLSRSPYYYNTGERHCPGLF